MYPMYIKCVSLVYPMYIYVYLWVRYMFDKCVAEKLLNSISTMNFNSKSVQVASNLPQILYIALSIYF